MQANRPLPGIVCDIDGVLILDKKALPTGADVVKFLKKPLHQIDPEQFPHDNNKFLPFACLTNGGGMLEITKSESLNTLLDIKEGEGQFVGNEIIMNYTPLRQIMSTYKDRLVIASGVGTTDAMLHDIGLTKYVTVEEYGFMYPKMVPVIGKERDPAIADEMRKKIAKRLDITDLAELDKPLQIHAIFILNDPPNWYEYIQIITDLALTSDGSVPDKIPDEVTNEHIPIYCTNNDMVYAGAFQLPRMTVGSFNEVLKHLYKVMYKKDLKMHMYGKPFDVTYKYTEEHLKKLANTEISKMYMIGDNPKSDIRGARASGWVSILVETGVFKTDENILNDSVDPADYVVKDAKEAIKLILKLENIKCDL